MTLVAVATKLLLFLANLEQESMAMYTIFANLLIILVGSFFSVRQFKISNAGSDMKSDVKAGMKTTTLFAVFLSIFGLIYYNYIDTHYFSMMIADRVEMATAAAIDNPDVNVDNWERLGENLFNPRTHATVTLLGLTIVGAIYSFLINISSFVKLLSSR